MRYVDRTDAGRRLAPVIAEALARWEPGYGKPVVLGIPRGGVVVGGEVAQALSADLDVVLARKIGAPHNPELAIGAIGEDGDPVLDEDLVASLGVSDEYLKVTLEVERHELRRRSAQYRAERTAPDIAGRIVIVVDDGIATGATLLATLETLRRHQPQLLVCAVPVGAPDSVDRIARHVDHMICPMQPPRFRAVGEWFETFTQTMDAEVVAILEEARSGSQ